MEIVSKKSKEKGITLVALVVTIIVLLILAGVSLNLIFGNDGIIAKARNVASESDRAKAKEQAEIYVLNETSEYYDENYVQGRNVGTLLDYIKIKIGSGVTIGEDYWMMVVTEEGKVDFMYKVASLDETYADTDFTSLNIIVGKGKTLLQAAATPIVEGEIGERGSISWKETINSSVTPQETTYTIRYNANTGTGTMENTTGTTVSAAANEFVGASGAVFTGWNTSADGSGTDYAVGDRVDRTVELYAQWNYPRLSSILTANHVGLSTNYSVTISGTTFGNSSWKLLALEDFDGDEQNEIILMLDHELTSEEFNVLVADGLEDNYIVSSAAGSDGVYIRAAEGKDFGFKCVLTYGDSVKIDGLGSPVSCLTAQFCPEFTWIEFAGGDYTINAHSNSCIFSSAKEFLYPNGTTGYWVSGEQSIMWHTEVDADDLTLDDNYGQNGLRPCVVLDDSVKGYVGTTINITGD